MYNLKKHYQTFFKANPELLHFCAHSHHPWPDITFEAQKNYWLHSARTTDKKWDKIFSETLPKAQKTIASNLNVERASSIAFANNTHELLMRLLSCLLFEKDKKIKILTTNNEFHSFTRQIRRLEETEKIAARRISFENQNDLVQKLESELKENHFDFIFLSHVFFNNGLALTDQDLLRITQACPDESMIVVDGYHSFMARPVDLSSINHPNFFYLAGGYKYAQSGEGACFLLAPKNCQQRPVYTGWLASFDQLESSKKEVIYSDDGMRFMGATFDPSGLYRFNAVSDWLDDIGIKVPDIHEHVLGLQAKLEDALLKHPSLGPSLQHKISDNIGHFHCIKHPKAIDITKDLAKKGITCDARGDILRLGIGIYHTESDIEELNEKLNLYHPNF